MKKANEVDPIYVQFIKEFKRQIALRNLTQTEVASMLDTSDICIRNWIYFRRQMSGEYVVKVCKIFGIDCSKFTLEEKYERSCY